jgi:hypothetical protein
MKHRKLRIAWSVASGVVAVLLVVLWARSFWWEDTLGAPDPTRKAVGAKSGGGWLYIQRGDSIKSRVQWDQSTETEETRLEEGKRLFELSKPRLRFRRHYVLIPHWLLAFTIVTVAAAPWLRFRFSLHSFLIATTLVAVALGLIAWASR